MKMHTSVEFFGNKRNNKDYFFLNMVCFSVLFIQILMVQLVEIDAIVNETTTYPP